MKILRRLLSAIDGSVAVETALVVSLFLAPTILCVWDFAQLYQGQAAVDEALQNAVTYVMSNGSNATTAGAQQAAQAANGSSISVSASTVCYCISTNTSSPTVPSSVSCSGTCSANSVFQKFMSITTTNSVTIPFPVSWINLTSPYSVTAAGHVRTG